MLIQELLQLREAKTEKVKCFKVSWPEGYGKQKPKKVGMDWFSDDNGFTQGNIDEIADLDVGEEWTGGGPRDTVNIERLKDCTADKLQESQVNEGAYVVTNIDGKEKRFKDKNSSEARAWASSRSKIAQPKSAKYSQGWWEEKEYDVPAVPWDKITDNELDFKDKAMMDVVNAIHIDPKTVDYASVEKNFKKTVDGVETAHAEIRMTYEYNLADLGIEDDSENNNSGLEGLWFVIRRDTKQPEKFVFVKFTG